MTFNIFQIIAIIGLISIIIGLLIMPKTPLRRKYTYPLFILGGICLLIYSIYINEIIFIILQSVIILVAVYNLIKVNKNKK